MSLIQNILNKIDYKLTGDSFSRPQKQVELLIEEFNRLTQKKNFCVTVDLGGGHNPQYKEDLVKFSSKYFNIEISDGPGVDLVGSAYDIPLKSNAADLITMFMVLEHLNEPEKAIKECHRVLKKGGVLLITTVQYWHTHNHPSDYYRYTKEGLKYLCNKNKFKTLKIWSMGGPYLVLFHVIELNLPGLWRTLFSILFYKFFDWLDWIVYKHEDLRSNSDSVGWTCIFRKL